MYSPHTNSSIKNTPSKSKSAPFIIKERNSEGMPKKMIEGTPKNRMTSSARLCPKRIGLFPNAVQINGWGDRTYIYI